MKQLSINLSEELVAAIDKEAEYCMMTRTAMIRRMLIGYLHFEADTTGSGSSPTSQRDTLYADPDELLKILQHRRLQAGVRDMLREAKKERARHYKAK